MIMYNLELLDNVGYFLKHLIPLKNCDKRDALLEGVDRCNYA